MLHISWRSLAPILTAAAMMTTFVTPALAQDPDFQPAPASIGADIPATYFGPPPSSLDKRLVGPVQLLQSGTVDQDKGTIELPLYRGQLPDGRNVWYVLTDTTDQGNGDALGLNVSHKLAFGATGNGSRTATLDSDGTLTFDAGTVDFSPEHVLVPGDAPVFFPPKTAQPGSVGDADYSPLVTITNAGGETYNAPIIAFDVSADQLQFAGDKVDYSIVHDKVLAIDATENGGTVTLALTTGFSFAKPVLISASRHPTRWPRTLESATLAPALADVRVGGDDGAFSAVERLFAVVNGPTGSDNPQRQGFDSALSDGRGPLNVLGGIPTVATDYSPLWDVNLAVWSDEAIAKGYRSRVIEEFQILGLVQQGWLTGGPGADFGSSGVVVNCPIVMRLL